MGKRRTRAVYSTPQIACQDSPFALREERRTHTLSR
jgi:hypothetical protein